MVDWLRRRRRSSDASEERETVSAPPAVEQRAPGVAEVLEGAGPGRTHSVLDLGAATDSSLQVYSRFARRIRFADLFADTTTREGRARALRALPAQPDEPYDLVFAWDILDRLFPEERPRLVQRLAEITAPGARLHVVIDASESSGVRPHRFALLDTGRVQCESVGPARPARRPLLPAEVERLLDPFQVVRAFTLKGGFREYVAVRSKG